MNRLREIFDGAIDKSGNERRAFLDGACVGDPGLRAQIESLIAAGEEGDEFLSSPTADSGRAPGAVTMELPLREGPGTRVGPYKLLQLIGEGGFGSVFMAEQEKPVARKVALKIIKLGMDTRQVVARFEQERQALAMMDHPNIARVLDAGATETGRPFFAMELVKGDPIVEYCDKNNLSIQDRLELFAQVCNAVQHAHTKGIIHRDIKPSNILVSTQDGRPHTKVIDFGIAKATASKLTEKTLFTEHKALIGTPEYMSPEQAEGNLDIDTRTDVYSLGVLLYELLTGTTPFSSQELRSAAYAEIQRIIREVEPPKPSTRISQNTDSIASIATKRHTEPKRLGTVVRGELDWIVMKAMEKDRQRRYETANGLAADIRRYLGGEAVVAAPPSASYRFRKFVRRNRVMVAAGGAVAAALLIGVIGTTTGMMHAMAERERADGETRKATLAAEAESTARLEAQENEQAAVKQAMLALTTMQVVQTDIDSKLAAQPGMTELRISVLQALEKQWNELDVSLAGGVKGTAIPTLMAVRTKIADSWVTLGRIAEADAQYEKLHTMARSRVLEKNRSDTSRHNLALVCVKWAPVKFNRGDNPAKAEALLDEAIELIREIGRDPRPEPGSPPSYQFAATLQSALQQSAGRAIMRGDLAKAEAAYADASERSESQLQAIDSGASWFVELKPERQQSVRQSSVQSLENARAGLANCLVRRGKADEAVAIYRPIIEQWRAVVAAAPENANRRSQLALHLTNFGRQMSRSGRFDEAATLIAEAFAMFEVLSQADPTNAGLQQLHATSAYYLAVARDGQGRGDEARDLLEVSRRTREALVRLSPDKSSKVNLMLALARLGDVSGTQSLATELSAKLDADPDLRLDIARAMAQLARHTPEPARRDALRAASFAALNRCIDDGQKDPFSISSEPDLAPLREDARFSEILRRVTAAAEGKR